MRDITCKVASETLAFSKHVLCFLDDLSLVCGYLPQGAEDDTDVVADRELVVELTAGAGRLNVCNIIIAR